MEHTLTYKSPPKYSTYRKRHEDRYHGQELITENEFRTISSMNCSYCGAVGPNGIDRIDSSKGYCADNCVPSCKHCNYVKGNLSMSDFMKWTEKFVKYQKNNPIWKTE